MKTHKVKISYWTESDIQPEIVEFETDDINWSMGQYQRNREPFRWEIIE